MSIDITPVLDPNAGEALYLQIYKYILEEIRKGTIPPHTRLPSIRKLAQYLNISRNPIETAYQQLIAEGYIESRPRSGLYTMELEERFNPPKPPALTDTSPINRRYHAAAGEPIRYDFGYGRVDLDQFPFAVWRKLMNRCFLPENRHIFLYGDLQGEPELRREIAKYLHQARGVSCRPEQIVIGAGTYHSMDLLCQLLKPHTHLIAVEEAVNDGIQSLFRQHGFPFKPVSLEKDGIRVQELYESPVQAVYVTPSHQFPYGMVMSIAKRLKLLKWAEEQNGLIIENDYDGEFRYRGKPIPALQGLDSSGRVVYLGTFSRALTPAFRISFLVLPPLLLERFRQHVHSYDQLASPIHQKTLQLFMQSGHFERHVRKMRNHYQKKHAALLGAVETSMGNRVRVIGESSGLHIVLEVRNGMEETELIRRGQTVGVQVYPTSIYRVDSEKARSSSVLLGFGGMSAEEIVRGIERLSEAWFGRP